MTKVAKSLAIIKSKLPTWFKMRKDPNTIGSKFLNVVGLTIDDIDDILNYAYEQVYIDKADINQVDIVYRANIPSTVTEETDLAIRSKYMTLIKAKDLRQFMTSLQTDKLNHTEVFYDDPYYMDFEHRYIYVRKPYDSTIDKKPGEIRLITYDTTTGEEIVTILDLALHHVWNFFDEFGLLLATPRLFGETNKEYKQRILDVFRRQASSTKRGLYHGITRELGLMKEEIWRNPEEGFIIRDARVDVESIFINDQKLPSRFIEKDESGRIILSADYTLGEAPFVVSYSYGVTLHEFHDKKDYAFQELLFDIDGHGTPVLQYYVDIVNDKVPIMWDHFVWGLSFWDVADAETTGYAVIPTFYDAKFSNWKNYKL